MFELAHIDIEGRAAQMALVERVGERVLVDNLAARNIDKDTALLHQREALLVEETRRLRRPLAAHDNEIALRQQAVKLRGPG